MPHRIATSKFPADERPITGLHELVEQQTLRTPERIAVATAGDALTYAELAAAADRLAVGLREAGLPPRSLIGLFLDRDCTLVVAVLAILKAGHAYLPLDPAYPRKRTRLLLEDSGARAILVRERDCVRFADIATTVMTVDGTLASPTGDLAPPPPGSADDLAYVLYTSGSTGSPKGIAIEHRSALALIQWATAFFSPAEFAGVLASTSMCFDLSVFELFAPLACGGTVLVADSLFDIDTLGPQRPVTLVNTVPSLMAQFLRDDVLPASVRTVNLAGEAVPDQLVAAIHATGTVRRVHNLYGPCEDTTYSTCGRVRPGERTTIGTPITGTSAYVLDEVGSPLPRGMVGELYLGGGGTARGYLNRPALTAERFLPDPYSATPGARMYRTGDLVRLTPSGSIEFIGRLDRQVKLRGVRVEVAEVEHALHACPGVLQAAVVVEAAQTPDASLVAYVVMAGTSDVGAVRRRLRRQLPHYLVPSKIMVVRSLPLTLSGKVDIRALDAGSRP